MPASSPSSSSGRTARARRLLRLLVLASAVAAPGPARGDEAFPPVTDAERRLTAIAGAPNAPGVVLFHDGEFQMLDLARGEASSRLTVRDRLKVLTGEGKGLGEVEIVHSAHVRLSHFEGRTVLPDGRVIPLPADAKFVRRSSQSRKRFVTAVAFPAVEVGAILDYRYELRFDSVFLLDPWYFSARLPTLRSQVRYLVPKSVAVQTWNRDPFAVGVKVESSPWVRGVEVRATAERVPAVPAEPFGVPFEDLAAQVMLLPTHWSAPNAVERLMESWASTSELLLLQYERAKKGGIAAARTAAEIARSAGKGQREQAAALYRHVRDAVETTGHDGVLLAEGSTLDRTLEIGRGDSLDKALLLAAMLKAVKVPARLVWAADRGGGLIDLRLANPAWFQTALVAAELDGGRVYLDPSDRALGFGQLPADLEGTVAVLPDARKPEAVTLPETPAGESVRRATLKLEVDDQGLLRGTGTLRLTGQEATARGHWNEDAEHTAAAWKDWLAAAYKDAAISDVQATESPEERTIEVRWALAARAEEALGDEVTLLPSRPLGPAQQPFTVATAKRRSPILFDHARRDEVELELRWPAGWKLEAQPRAAHQEEDGLGLVTEVAVKEAERTLVYRRRFELGRKQFATPAECEHVRALYEAAQRSDAEAVVLARQR